MGQTNRSLWVWSWVSDLPSGFTLHEVEYILRRALRLIACMDYADVFGSRNQHPSVAFPLALSATAMEVTGLNTGIGFMNLNGLSAIRHYILPWVNLAAIAAMHFTFVLVPPPAYAYVF